MTTDDLAFAQAVVRALGIINQAAKEWVKAKTIEFAPKKEPKEQDSQQQ